MASVDAELAVASIRMAQIMLCDGNILSMSSSLSHNVVLLVKDFSTVLEMMLSTNSKRNLTMMVSLVAKLP